MQDKAIIVWPLMGVYLNVKYDDIRAKINC